MTYRDFREWAVAIGACSDCYILGTDDDRCCEKHDPKKIEGFPTEPFSTEEVEDAVRADQKAAKTA